MADEKIWRPLELVKVTAEYLAAKHVPSPRLDAEVLLCAVLGLKKRVDLYAGFETEISGKNLAAYRELVRRRSAREPVSRILGRREFMGIDFLVTPDVLSPRPETELLVEAVIDCVNPKKNTPPPDESPGGKEPAAAHSEEEALDGTILEQLLDSYAEDVDDENDIDAEPPVKLPPMKQNAKQNAAKKSAQSARSAPKPAEHSVKNSAKSASAHSAAAPAASVLDLGTGSGCVAIAIAAHLPAARVVAVDASPKALAVAKKNAAGAKVDSRVEFRQGDWFAACRDGEVFDCVVSNPPYLIENDPAIWPEVAQYDPPAALYGGRDGLDCYRRIVPPAPERLAPEGWLFLEVGADQAKRVAEMLSRRGFRDVGIIADYGGIGRVVKGRAPGA